MRKTIIILAHGDTPSMWPKGPYQAPIQEAPILGGGGLKKPQWGKNRPLAYATNVSSCAA